MVRTMVGVSGRGGQCVVRHVQGKPGIDGGLMDSAHIELISEVARTP